MREKEYSKDELIPWVERHLRRSITFLSSDEEKKQLAVIAILEQHFSITDEERAEAVEWMDDMRVICKTVTPPIEGCENCPTGNCKEAIQTIRKVLGVTG